MLPAEIQKLCDLTSFEALIDYLRDELDWPIEAEDAEKVAFDYNPQELGIDPLHAVKIETIRQIRPLAEGQPWGVFYVEFESKQLPVIVLRRILHTLVPASRRRDPNRPAWKMSNLLFISSQGAVNNRSISFAHFHQNPDGKHELRTFSWDVRETHLYYIKNLNLYALRWPEHPQDTKQWRDQWSQAFIVSHRYVPTTAQMLAEEMARIAIDIRDAVNQIYALEHVGGPLHKLHLSLKMNLISDLSEDDFADMYAQTVTYGLFAARATRSGEFKQTDTSALIAHTNPFLRELLEQMMNQQSLDLDGLGVTELTDLLGIVNMEAILQDFGRQKRGEDPVIHFYETFMRAYDPKQKIRRGEFYTPDPVVSFIVRSVDCLLRTKFGCKDGFATHIGEGGFQPIVLDPATGTGTFLKYVIKVIWETFLEKNKKLSAADRRVKWNEFVRTYVLPRLYAFELKMSPYTIAHMKVDLELQQLGFDFKEGERLRIYLTNSLQPAHEIASVDTFALAHEAERANEVKNNVPVTVVIGNPPYSNFGMMNKGQWISYLLDDYKKGLNQQKLNLDDDFIKFIRFGQWRISQSGYGVLAFITNNTYIDGITHRRMRQSLLETFDEIYIFNLHGASIKKEVSPSGLKDENVFDIQQGVSIGFFVKRRKPSNTPSKVFYADLWGSREEKYRLLGELALTTGFSGVNWTRLNPTSPNFFFVPKYFDDSEEYSTGWKISEIFSINQNGIKTDRDDLFFDMERDTLQKRMQLFYSDDGILSPFKEQYRIENSSSYDILGKRSRTSFDAQNIHQSLYRPFDIQWLYYTVGVTSRPAWDVMSHLIAEDNLALIGMRQYEYKVPSYCYFLATNIITECRVFISNRGIANVFPLYIYKNEFGARIKQAEMFAGFGKKPNFSKKFINEVENILELKFKTDGQGDLIIDFGPEDIFNYMYAVFHSPIYRNRYAESLKIDFPRLALTGNLELFRQLCLLGKELVALHILKTPLLDQLITKYSGIGDNRVAKGHPKYQDGVVWINHTQGFEGVPENVWEFCIGGYQVCHKWLKDRRGRQLSQEDIVHYQKIVVALNETIRLMGEIDNVIDLHGGWPIR